MFHYTRDKSLVCHYRLHLHETVLVGFFYYFFCGFAHILCFGGSWALSGAAALVDKYSENIKN